MLLKKIEEANLISLMNVDDYKNPLIKLHFTHPSGAEWHIVAGDKLNNNDWLFFGIGKIITEELGPFTLNEILSVGAEYDDEWIEKPLYDILK